jgi:hypothetical protein
LGAALNFYLGYKRNQEETEQQEKPWAQCASFRRF